MAQPVSSDCGSLDSHNDSGYSTGRVGGGGSESTTAASSSPELWQLRRAGPGVESEATTSPELWQPGPAWSHLVISPSSLV